MNTVAQFNADDFAPLASCKLLQMLSVSFEGLADDFIPSVWAVIAESLTQLCPRIRKIRLRFCVDLDSSNANNALEFHFEDGIEALEPVFERDALSGVEQVLIDLRIDHGYRGDEAPKAPITLEQIEEVIRLKLPQLHKRGKARVEYRHNPYRLPDDVSAGHPSHESSQYALKLTHFLFHLQEPQIEVEAKAEGEGESHADA